MWKTILLFVLLSPGVLITLPPVGKNIWMSGKTSLLSVCVHALIFVVVMHLLNVREGFTAAFVNSSPSNVNAENNNAEAKDKGIRKSADYSKAKDKGTRKSVDYSKAKDKGSRKSADYSKAQRGSSLITSISKILGISR